MRTSLIGSLVVSGFVIVLSAHGQPEFAGFAPQQQYTMSATESLNLVDLNGSGALDIVGVSPWYGDVVSVLANNGQSTFAPQQLFTATPGTMAVIARDLNGNGSPDLAVLSIGDVPGRCFSSVSIMAGNGDGTFEPPVLVHQFPDQWCFFAMAVADLNGNGLNDIVVVRNGGSFAGSVHVLLSDGTGEFAALDGVPVGVGARAVEVADYNNDGIPDLVVANYGEDTISVLLGNGDGTFAPQQKFAVGVLPIDIAVGDFTGVGTMDLAVANHGGYVDDTVSVLLGWGTGTFDPQVKYDVGVTPTTVAAGDLNQDGALDLAVGYLYHFATVSVLLGHGNGTFAPTIDFEAGEYPVDVVIGDVTGNGTLDIVAGEWGAGWVSVLANETKPLPVPGDLNGDGVVDVSDLLILLGQWGECADCNDCPADLNDDCTVDVSDLLILLGNWG